MDKDYAIKVENLSKSFRIPHDKKYTLRDRVLNLGRSGRYETFKALDNISFQVNKGDNFGIIGRNGSGKSTLLKILAGIYTPDKGSVKIDGEISPFLELGVGFNQELSGRDNIFYNGMILGLTKKEVQAKYQDIVDFSELERFIDQKLKNYSSGMYVRLAFSMAVHANKDILLMDEVLAVGDIYFQEKCLIELDKLKNSGKTIIFVSHDLKAVQDYCEKVILLENGRCVATGSASQVIEHYHKQPAH